MLRQRVITAVIALAILLLALFVLPEALTRGIIAVLMATAAWEWSGFLSLKGKAARLTYAAGLTVLAGALIWFDAEGAYRMQIVTLAVVWWSVAFLWLFFYPTPVPQPVAWLCGALVIVPAWLAIDWLYRLQPLLLLFVLTIVWAADIGAYFAGRRFGRVKLAPEISPGKSWEGVIGGMLAVLLLAVGIGLQSGTALPVLLPLCLAVAAVSVVGDLTVSIFKRHAGLKDSGAVFPGHGGVLDRIDSTTAAAPVFVLGMTWAGVA